MILISFTLNQLSSLIPGIVILSSGTGLRIFDTRNFASLLTSTPTGHLDQITSIEHKSAAANEQQQQQVIDSIYSDCCCLLVFRPFDHRVQKAEVLVVERKAACKEYIQQHAAGPYICLVGIVFY